VPTSYTVKNLSEVPDSAPQFGLELLAFGPRHEDDGEVVLDWWTGAIAPVDTPAGSAVRTECWRA